MDVGGLDRLSFHDQHINRGDARDYMGERKLENVLEWASDTYKGEARVPSGVASLPCMETRAARRWCKQWRMTPVHEGLRYWVPASIAGDGGEDA